MSDAGAGTPPPVLLDTDVFSRVFVGPRSNQLSVAWSTALAGRTVTIAVQTAVELRAWPQLFGWGPKRTAELLATLASVGTIQVSQLVQDEYVRLTAWAKDNGHAIYQKVHTADRWIAATAVAHGLEIAAGDGIYDRIPNLGRFPGIP